MVVSFDIYEVFNVVVSILCIAYVFFIFAGREETYSKVIRLICAFALVVINTFKIPMNISMGNSYGVEIFMVILWLVNVVVVSIQLGDDW